MQTFISARFWWPHLYINRWPHFNSVTGIRISRTNCTFSVFEVLRLHGLKLERHAVWGLMWSGSGRARSHIVQSPRIYPRCMQWSDYIFRRRKYSTKSANICRSTSLPAFAVSWVFRLPHLYRGSRSVPRKRGGKDYWSPKRGRLKIWNQMPQSFAERQTVISPYSPGRGSGWQTNNR